MRHKLFLPIFSIIFLIVLMSGSFVFAATQSCSDFVGWTGSIHTDDPCYGISSANSSCGFNMYADREITANFSIITHTITASAEVGGSISSPGETTLNCGSSKTYNITASSGYRIKEVRVDGNIISGAPSSYTFNNVTGDHIITVNFIALYTLTVNKSGTGNVTSDWGGINCGSTCSAIYDSGSDIQLSSGLGPSPSWTGCDSVYLWVCFIIMDRNKTVTATFSST